MIIITGIIMYFVGAVCKYLHDDYNQYPNIHVGYKIGTGMRDRETWEEANDYIYKASTVSLIFAISFTLLVKVMDFKIASIVYFMIQILIIFVPIVSTEIHLYKFNKK